MPNVPKPPPLDPEHLPDLIGVRPVAGVVGGMGSIQPIVVRGEVVVPSGAVSQ